MLAGTLENWQTFYAKTLGETEEERILYYLFYSPTCRHLSVLAGSLDDSN